jgi:hypothetical protein
VVDLFALPAALPVYLFAHSCRVQNLPWPALRLAPHDHPSAYRIQRLRERIGVSPRPFGRLPRRQPHCSRFNRIAATIKREERLLLGRLRDVTDGLEELVRKVRCER